MSENFDGRAVLKVSRSINIALRALIYPMSLILQEPQLLKTAVYLPIHERSHIRWCNLNFQFAAQCEMRMDKCKPKHRHRRNVTSHLSFDLTALEGWWTKIFGWWKWWCIVGSPCKFALLGILDIRSMQGKRKSPFRLSNDNNTEGELWLMEMMMNIQEASNMFDRIMRNNMKCLGFRHF